MTNMDLRKELIDFENWRSENIKPIGDDDAESVVDWYLSKSINCASDETQADRQNEQTEKVCNNCKYSETLKYCHTCDDELSHWKGKT